jgi:glutamyl-tRNA reductase
MIIGEFEVLGQVRRALEEAEKSHLIGLPLLELFRSAVRAGRRVRLETAISKNAVSISSVAVDLAEQVVGDISFLKVVVIGAGEAGSLVAKVCKERGVSRIVVVSRSRDKGEDLAKVLDGSWAPRESLSRELADCDIVISCSGAPHLILKTGLLSEVMIARPEHPLVIIDIAVPQDVEPEAGKLNNVFLYDIDELTQTCEVNQQERRCEIGEAMNIVADEVARFMHEWQQFEVRPVISALVEKSEEIRRAQLELTLKKLPGLSDEERSYLEAMTKAIVQKMLNEPIQHLKNDMRNREDYVRVISELFHLNGKKPSEEANRHRFSGQQTG